MAGTPMRRPYWTPDAPVVRLSVDERREYAQEIRDRIADTSLTYTWLIRQLSDDGMITDKFEMSSTLSGTRTGDKSDEILRRSLDILREYQDKMKSCRNP